MDFDLYLRNNNTNMIYNSSHPLPKKETNKRCVFLAGSISSDEQTNWRKHVIDALQHTYVIFDPTHKKYNTLKEKELEHQTEWELEAMNMADVILLNFLPNSLSPLSFVELGLYVASNKLLVVCPLKFYKRSYVNTLCKKYSTPIYTTIEQALNTLN